jgi:hypothetical protein
VNEPSKDYSIKNQKLVKSYRTTFFKRKDGLTTEENDSKSLVMPPIPIHSKTLSNSTSKLKPLPKAHMGISKFTSQPQMEKFILFSTGNYSHENSK